METLLFYYVCALPLLLIGSLVMGWQKGINTKHKASGIRSTCKVGYSWSYYLFGFFVPIFRGEIGIGLFHLVLTVCTFGVFQLFMPFLYNKQHATRQMVDGWELNDLEENNALARMKLNMAGF